MPQATCRSPRARLALALVVAAVLPLGASIVAASEAGTNQSNIGSPPPKAAEISTWIRPTHPTAAGDNVGTALVIPSLPYTNSGNTCGFGNDYAFPCGDANSTPAPDVVYSFTPSTTMCVDISLCNSDFDTGLYVWQASVGNLVACNDDYCGPTGQQSRIAGLQLQAGVTYYIVVDAYSGCGNYALTVTQGPCKQSCAPIACPAGATPEGEPVCFTGYTDNFDGGCNSVPPVYKNITIPSTICGTYGKYCSDDFFCFSVFRDTDWYRLVVTSPMTVHVCVQGEANTQLDVNDGSAGCPGPILTGSIGLPPACDTYCEDLALGVGTYWIFVAPQADNTFPVCGSRYVLSVAPVAVVAAKHTSWSKLKAMYR